MFYITQVLQMLQGTKKGLETAYKTSRRFVITRTIIFPTIEQIQSIVSMLYTRIHRKYLYKCCFSKPKFIFFFFAFCLNVRKLFHFFCIVELVIVALCYNQSIRAYFATKKGRQVVVHQEAWYWYTYLIACELIQHWAKFSCLFRG